jgi:hypothetical protein
MLAALYKIPASVRVCCSRACARRAGDVAGLTSKFVIARRKRFTSSAAKRIRTRYRAVETAGCEKKDRKLDMVFTGTGV